MHIFLVNDDGIGAKGIMALYRAALERGHEVTMCAPRDHQSGASHRFTFSDPLYVTDYPLEGAKGYAIAGTPADCVRIGLQALVEKPVDVLISGINEGYNGGVATHYSGTVGAAMEGAFHYLPSIATSIHFRATQEMIDHMARYTIMAAEKYAKVKAPRCTILNLNAPLCRPEELKPAVYAPLATAYYHDLYEKRVAPRRGDYFWLAGGAPMEEPEEGSDLWYLDRGHITHTLLGHFHSAEEALWKDMNID